MTESAGTSQAGAAAPDVERLIAEASKFHCVSQVDRDSWLYRRKREGEAANPDDLMHVDVAADALSAAHTREAELQSRLDKLKEAFNQNEALTNSLTLQLEQAESQTSKHYELRCAAELRADRSEDYAKRVGDALAKIGELLKTGGMNDAHYLAGAVRALLEREAALRAENERLTGELDAANQHVKVLQSLAAVELPPQT